MQKDMFTIISCIVIIVGLLFQSVISIESANSIITEEEFATRQQAQVSAKVQAMQELTWKNYTNSEFGFSIEYPQPFGSPKLFPTDWSETDNTLPADDYRFVFENYEPVKALFYNYETDENSLLPSFSATLSVYPADRYDKTLDQFMSVDYYRALDQFRSKDSSGNIIFNPRSHPTEISIAGNTTGLEYNGISILGEPEKFVGFVHDKYIYVFSSDDIDSKDRQTLYDHMLNSIKFVNVVDSDDNNDQIDLNEGNFQDSQNSDERDNNNDDDDN
jgi:hypothetical protein